MLIVLVKINCNISLSLKCVFMFLFAIRPSIKYMFVFLFNAALTYTEYPLRMLKIEIRAEITEYDANGRGGACTKRCLCESVKNACGSLQMS